MNEILFFIIVFLANIIEAITGFAGTMLAMPISMRLIGADEAKVILNVIAIILATGTTIRYHKHINVKEFVKILIFMIIGMAVGVYLYSTLDINFLLKIYGVIILLVAINGLWGKKIRHLSPIAGVIILIAAGVIHGMFLSGGALLVIYAISTLKNKAVIRSTLAPTWIVLNCILLTQDIMRGAFTPTTINMTLVSLVPLFVAFIIGGILHKKMNQDFFVKLTYSLLIISSITLFF